MVPDSCGGGGSNYNDMGHYESQSSSFGPMKSFGGGGGRSFGKMEASTVWIDTSFLYF